MSAPEQKRKLERRASKGFIIRNKSSALAVYPTHQDGLRLSGADATSGLHRVTKNEAAYFMSRPELDCRGVLHLWRRPRHDGPMSVRVSDRVSCPRAGERKPDNLP